MDEECSKCCDEESHSECDSDLAETIVDEGVELSEEDEVEDLTSTLGDSGDFSDDG